MKLYVYNRGWAGMSVVIADNALDAALLLKEEGVRDCDDITESDMTEYEIVRGLVIDNLGDA